MILPGSPRMVTRQGGSVPYLPIPAMTSNTTPAGFVASASNEASSNYAAWRAFNKGATNQPWWMTSNNGWIQLSLPQEALVVSYRIQANSNSAASRAPRDFALQGSNDGTVWTNVDDRAGETGWADSEVRQYYATSPGAYSHYRLNITANNGDTGNTQVAELELLQEDDL